MIQFGYVCLFFSALCSAIASILLKYPDRLGILAISTNPILIKLPAIIFYGAGFVLYSLGLKDIDVSKAYPVMVSFAILQVLAFGLFFGESITIKMIIGTAFVIVGILLISAK
ncbi:MULTISPECIES: DMT family transporter [Yersinia]|uniref:Ligand-binding protein SH3 n=1 Tax=Yersinia massiliensis TaxID=419257 RepID=A0ABM6UVK0_9GAMM|nr:MULTISPECIES: SMR family transporter [Yersinia]AVX39026.1 ligand-binding protein SH3 [Yersinia massiliensis]MDN0103895.1 SMR family transporter [Yersinia bercovieri]QDW34415.1 EamA family transporter [Yersinia sp. KBS0713]